MKNNIDSVEIVELVKIKHTIGNGTEENPSREIVEYWTKDGDFIFLLDPIKDYCSVNLGVQ